MSDKGLKLLAKIRRSPGNATRQEVVSLYLAWGFELRHGTNHDIITHPVHTDLRETLPRHDPILKTYVYRAVKNIEEVQRRASS